VRKISPPPGFDPQTFQPVAGRYTDYDIPVPHKEYVKHKNNKCNIKQNKKSVGVKE
jgi:hypothetical protein